MGVFFGLDDMMDMTDMICTLVLWLAFGLERYLFHVLNY
jgi:hypothetical protein